MVPAAPPHSSVDVDDDDPEELPCYRHPDRLTALQCIECERPICTDCAVTAAVGFKCPDDARISRAARGVVPPARLALGAAVALVVSVIAGALLWNFRIGFFLILISYGVGLLVGLVARKASGGYRDPTLANLAGAAAAIGVLALPTLHVLTGGRLGLSLLFYAIAGVAAAIAAHNKVLE
ncbi:MAG: hypothetical protein H7287_00700 [Thermoleophilia bacterium]|nr:hypothetical protein [Thermoleophilia bacterium]